VADFSGLDEFEQDIGQFVVVEFAVADGMVLKQVDMVGAESDERILDLLAGVGGRALVAAFHEAGEAVAELGGNDPSVAIAAGFDGPADELFGGVVAVALGGVDEIDPAVGGGGEELIDFRLLEVFPPLAAELPRAHADDRDAKIGSTEAAVFHGGDCNRKRSFHRGDAEDAEKTKLRRKGFAARSLMWAAAVSCRIRGSDSVWRGDRSRRRGRDRASGDSIANDVICSRR